MRATIRVVDLLRFEFLLGAAIAAMWLAPGVGLAQQGRRISGADDAAGAAPAPRGKAPAAKPPWRPATDAPAAAIYPHPFNVSEVGSTISGIRIFGAVAGDHFGPGVAGAGDVDGDGYPEILGSAYLADPGGRTDAGRVYLIDGSQLVGNTTLDLNGAPAAAVTVFEGLTANDNLGGFSGSGVSGAGDFNGDGYADVLMGATKEANPSAYGAAYLIFGGAGGIGSGGAFNLATLNGGNGVRFDSAFTDAWFGGSLSGISDCNGDGYADVVISSIWADPGGRNNAGEGYVIYGAATPPGAGGVFSMNSIVAATGARVPGIDVDDHCGTCISGAGDVNGDGLGDFIITAPDGDPAGRADAGETYIVFGSSSGIGSGGAFNLGALNGANGVRLDGRNASDSFNGTYIGLFCGEAGDVNGDGYGDVLVGAQFADPGGLIEAGECYLVYGAPTIGAGGALDLGALNGANGVRFDGALAADAIGRTVSSLGDVNGDGFADVALGVSNMSLPTGNGAVCLIYGSLDIGTGGVLRLADLDGDNGVRIDANANQRRLGYSASTLGDLNGDGVDDFILGASRSNPLGRAEAGEAFVIYGSTALTSATHRGFAATGVAHERWIGDIGDGKMAWGSSRCALAFADGSGGGTNGSSRQIVYLYRDLAAGGIDGLGAGALSDVANGAWRVTTTRAAWTAGTVRFRYLDSEIAGLTEANLRLFQAPAPTGPWTPLAGQTLDAARNQIAGDVSSLGYFALTAWVNRAPVPTAAANQTVVEGVGLLIAPSATFTDPDAFDTHAATVDWGDGTSTTANVTEAAGAGTVAPPAHSWTEDGTYIVTITLTDNWGAVAADTLQVTVTNAAPVVVGAGGRSVDEGAPLTIDPIATFSDLGVADTHTASIDWDDGAREAGTVTEAAGAGTVQVGAHVYADDGAYSVQVGVRDDDGAVTTATVAVGVANVAPSVEAGPNLSLNAWQAAALTATFTDPGTADTHTALVDWGDGATSIPVVVEAGGAGTATAAHRYVYRGDYLVTVTVTDDDGDASADTLLVTVLNTPPVVELYPVWGVWGVAPALGFTVRDDETDTCTVRCYYRVGAAGAWRAATLTPPLPGPIPATPGGASGQTWWDVLADLGTTETQVQFGIEAHDGLATGPLAISDLFAVDTLAPAAPALQPEPAFTAGTSNTVSWGLVSGASTYTLQVGLDAGFTAPLFADIDLAASAVQHSFNGLEDGRTYWYRLRARDAAWPDNVGDWSAAAFSTQDATPPASQVTAPSGISIQVDLIVEWTAGDVGGSGVAAVEVFWSKDGGATQSLGVFAPGAVSAPFNTGTHGGDGEYAFYTVATDAVGNIEAGAAADVTVTVNTVPPGLLRVDYFWQLLE